MDIQDLKEAYAVAEDAFKAAEAKLKEAAIGIYRLKVGDKVQVETYRGVKTGQVTRITVSITRYNPLLTRVSIRPEIYPFKKDGSVAVIGEIYVSDDNKITKVTEA